MDALMPEDERHHAFDEAVWSRHPDAGVNPRVIDSGRRWLQSPVRRGEHGVSRQTSRGECRTCSVVPVTNSCAFFAHLLHTRARVQRRPAFPAPSVLKEGIDRITRTKSSRESVDACLHRHCEFGPALRTPTRVG